VEAITMSDPLDDVLAKIVDEIYNRIGDMNKFDAIGLYDSLEALIKAYGEQCVQTENEEWLKIMNLFIPLKQKRRAIPDDLP
jgi:hypothetical protein